MNDLMREVGDRTDRNKTKSDIREMVLKPIDGKPMDSTGMVDKDLFTGENNLIAFMDPISSLWKVRFSHGVIPADLKQSFTSFHRLKDHVERYYNKRGIEITKVIE